MPDNPRVLFVSPQPFFESRGSSIRVKFNGLALTRLGYEVDLLTLPIGADIPGYPARVIRTLNLFGSRRIAIGPSALKLWFDFLLLLHGAWRVLRYRYAVVHGTEETGFLCYLLTFISRARCIYEKHSDSGSYTGTGFKKFILGAYNGVEHLTIRRSDHVICTGPGLAEQARAVADRPGISVIPDIPSSLEEPTEQAVATVRESLAPDPNAVIVTYVGSFAEYQGVEIIFSAIPGVLAANPDIRFLIIGGSAAEIDGARKQLEAEGVDDRVSFPGMIDPDHLPAWLAASDILLAPRKSGINSPLKILDYFKSGSAIVATSTVANRRLLNDDNARLCEFEVGAFTDAILSLAADGDERRRLGENACREYRETYNFDVFTRQLDAVYRQVLQG